MFTGSHITPLHSHPSHIIQKMSQEIENKTKTLTLHEKDSPLLALTKRDLYGGAITLAVPTKWRDVNQVRQLPDNQEVYQDRSISSLSTDAPGSDGGGGCLIVEILEYQKDVSDEDATSYFFNDLAEANLGYATTGNQLDYNRSWDSNIMLPNLSSSKEHQVKACCSCIGNQRVGPLENRTKLEEGKASNVRVELCVIRLECVETDLLISLTTALSSSNANTNQEEISNNEKKHDDENISHSDLFKSILSSLDIVEWSLFG